MKISESNVMTKVASIIEYIKNQTSKDIIQANNQKMINIDSNELQKLCSIIQTSIQSNFIKSSVEVSSLFNKRKE
jgi:hypothetical protein